MGERAGIRLVKVGDRYDDRYPVDREAIYPLPANKTAEPYLKPPGVAAFIALR